MALSSSTPCDLCGLPVIGRPVRGEHGAYCCEGCRRVDEVARDAGIEVGSAGRDAREGRAETAARRKAAAAAATGARRDTFHVEGMWCASCSIVLVDALMALPGVLDAEVSHAASLARVTRDPETVSQDQVRERFRLLGYEATTAAEASAGPVDAGDLFLRLFVSLVLDMWVTWPTWLAIWPEAAAHGWQSQRPLEAFTAAASLIVLLFGGWPFLKGAWQAIRVRRVTMDTLVVLGTWTAWLYSAWALATRSGPTYFDSASMITMIVLLGRWIETLSAREHVTGAGPRGALRAWRMSGGDASAAAEEVEASDLRAGDLVLVRPGEFAPADGVVIEGASELNRSLLTGESLPTRCAEGDEVWALTLNLGEPLLVRVERVGEASLAGRLSAIVEDAAFARSHAERLADAVSALFVPAVMAGSLLAAVAALVAGVPLSAAVSRAVAALVVACPCALALATPLAMMHASAAAARRGALLRGSPVFERVGSIDVVAFDKTGTLTLGAPNYLGILCDGDGNTPCTADETRLLAAAVGLEAGEPHPVARALVAAASERGAEPTGELSAQRVPGEGVEGRSASGRLWLLGSERLLQRHGVTVSVQLARQAAEARARGELVVWLADRNAAVYGLRFADEIRPEAGAVVAGLISRGKRVAMVSGDAKATCQAVAQRLGIGEVHSEVLPHEKETVVRELKRHGQVAFVGDGLNDSAALAAGDLAIGVEGSSDVAVLAADVVLLKTAGEHGASSPLASTLALLDIASAARRVIRQNLVWAFTYNLVAFPLAASGRLSPVWAAAAMAVSSLAVVANSLRLRAPRAVSPDLGRAGDAGWLRGYAPSASPAEKSVEPSS